VHYLAAGAWSVRLPAADLGAALSAAAPSGLAVETLSTEAPLGADPLDALTMTGSRLFTTWRLPVSVTSTVWVVARLTTSCVPGRNVRRLPFIAVSCETVMP
jgi:hypothetical protein